MAERRPALRTPLAVPSDGGEMAALIRATDWSKTPLGPIESWSQSLRMMVSFLLANRFPLLLWWGPQYVSIYNDAYRPILGNKHPAAIAQPVRECWSEIWDILKPLIDTPFAGGPSTWMDDIALEINRNGFVEETHFTIAYSPVPDDTAPGGIGGVLATVHEITEKIVGERRLAVLRDLGARAGEAKTAEEACEIAVETLASHAKDVPFALVYLIDEDARHARLACAAGSSDDPEFAPDAVDLDEKATPGSRWPLRQAAASTTTLVIADLATRFTAVPPGPWADPPQTAVLVPLRAAQAQKLAGVLVAGVSARLELDARYRSFLELVAAQIATAIANARAYQEERRRAEALAEIDRAKTAFFSNASHEFRTPLTLLLSPLEDLLLRGHAEPTIIAERCELAMMHRNGLRLLKLVNTLLDFSRIEAGRFEAVYEPVDLAAFTTELASSFRSAMERAGLSYRVECRQPEAPVYVDRDMWEKIVLNLLSNAFKYTFVGEVAISLAPAAGGREEVTLSVSDTGIGIPAHELPRLFERFHRVEGQPGRSQEGTGIGLALVSELVRLHGGQIAVDSSPGVGSTFRVTIPIGSAHLPTDRIGAARILAPAAIRAEAFVEEALRWLDVEPGAEPSVAGEISHPVPASASAAAAPRALVLLADDNTDMRDYVRRLLAERFEVVAVADGAAALDAARRRCPDLILSDVMMPRLDGFGLLRAVRNDVRLREIPFVLLSARAGEDARVEGMDAGADDYMTKPFAARELVARVAANLELARLRRESAEALRSRTAELETLLETAPVGVWFTSDAEARQVWGNRHAAALLRLPEGTSASLTAPESERPRHFQIWRDGVEADPWGLPLQRAARGEEVRGDEIEFRFADGDCLTLLAHAAPLRDSAGRVTGAVCAGLDITAHKDAEAGLRRFAETLEERVIAEIDRRSQAETALRQAQKMEAIGQLTGGVAHDMNNLLLVIQGNLEILERRLEQAPKRDPMRQPVRRALDGVGRAAALTQRLLAFARQQPLDPKPIEPDRLVAGMSDLLRRTLGETIAIETRLAGGVWRIFADPNQLENAIINLAVNARDAMPDGGTLTLQTVNARLDAAEFGPEAEIASGDHVLIAVGDTGTGMSREDAARAFDPFFTTKDIGKGTGLGLSQVYGFVKQSGGHVAIDSEPGRGTTVRIYLPRHQLEPERRTAETLSSAAPTGRGDECILVVEDNDEVRANDIRSLCELGYRAIGARDGVEALQRLSGDASIRLLFTDVGLPGGMNGRQLADAARLLRPGLEVLFTTGYARDAIMRDGRVEPGIALILKPFTHSALAFRVREALDRKR